MPLLLSLVLLVVGVPAGVLALRARRACWAHPAAPRGAGTGVEIRMVLLARLALVGSSRPRRSAALLLVYLGQRWRAAVVAGAGDGLMVLGLKTLHDRPWPPRLEEVIHYRGRAPSGHAEAHWWRRWC